MTDIRLPNISASADASTQMAQMRSYLYQMVEQLNWALSALDSGVAASLPVQTVGQAAPATSDETDQRMANLRDLIIKSAESVQMELDEIKKDYKSIASVTESYYKSNSPTELTGGTWTDTYPGWEPGTYIWTRSTVTYSDGSEPTTTTPVCVTGAKGDSGVDGVSPTVSITVLSVGDFIRRRTIATLVLTTSMKPSREARRLIWVEGSSMLLCEYP